MIEDNFTDRIEKFHFELATHYEIAENYDKTIEYLEKAGIQFDGLLDKIKARECYNKIITLGLKKMKTIKSLILLITIAFFTSIIPFSANAGHCSGKSGADWLVCNAGGDTDNSSGSSSTKKKKKKKSGKSLLQKLKEIGGSNVGGEG